MGDLSGYKCPYSPVLTRKKEKREEGRACTHVAGPQARPSSSAKRMAKRARCAAAAVGRAQPARTWAASIPCGYWQFLYPDRGSGEGVFVSE